jgi:predicted nucleic acid-binding Zn ribbon protein
MSSAKRSKSQLTPLSESLGRSLGRGFLNFTAQKLRVFEVWPQVVGEADAARTRPEMLHDGRLTVLVPGPAWMDRFSYKKPLWLERLNNELDSQAIVEEIILKVGEF